MSRTLLAKSAIIYKVFMYSVAYKHLFSQLFSITLLLWIAVPCAALPRAWAKQETKQTFLIHIPEIGIVRAELSGAGHSESRVREIARSTERNSTISVDLQRASLGARRVSGTTKIAVDAASSFTRGSKQVLFLPFSVTSFKRSHPRRTSYEIFLTKDSSGYSLDRIRRRSQRVARYCTQTPVEARASRMAAAPSVITPRAATLFLGLEVQVDSRFYSIYQSDSAAIVATVLQKVNTIYTNQLGIELRLVQQSIYTDKSSDPYGAAISSSGALLNLLQDNRISSSADLIHLFTSSRGYLDAIGLAYIGVVCSLAEFKFGWSDYASGFDIFTQTVAHEIGHNFNATHDSTDANGLMSVSQQVDVSNPYFSTFSLAEINGFLAANSACLSNSDDPALSSPGNVSYPSPDELRSNIRVSIKKRTAAGRARVSGQVSSLVSGRLSGRVIELRRYRDAKLLATKVSNANGGYSFSVRPKGTFYTVDRMSQRTSSVSVRF